MNRGMGELQIPTIQSIRQLAYHSNMTKELPIPKNEPLPRDDSSPTKLESLRDKLKAGKKLTDNEMDYLKSHDPQLYNKAVMLEMERATYEVAVRQYKTKTEVSAFHNQTLMSIMKPEPNHDPEESMMRVSAIQDSHRDYVRSNEYASLAWT